MHQIEHRARALLAVTAIVAWAALLLQLFLSGDTAIGNGLGLGHALVEYTGYFTITTNLLVALAASTARWSGCSPMGRFFQRPAAIGWVCCSIVFVGLAYHVLLRQLWQPQGLQLVADWSLHYATPLLYLFYSLSVLRGVAVRWSAPLWWALYPAVYFGYALLRGALGLRYPYGFIDVNQLGYALVWRNAGFLLAAYWLLAYLLVAVWRVGRAPAPQA